MPKLLYESVQAVAHAEADVIHLEYDTGHGAANVV